MRAVLDENVFTGQCSWSAQITVAQHLDARASAVCMNGRGKRVQANAGSGHSTSRSCMSPLRRAASAVVGRTRCGTKYVERASRGAVIGEAQERHICAQQVSALSLRRGAGC